MFQTDLKRAIQEISLGKPVALPTETVYGLAARIDQAEAIESIFKLKQRPFFDPLIIHVGSIEQARSVVSWWPAEAQELAEKTWPGPLTMVLPKASHINSMITSGLESVAVRWPKHPAFQSVLDSIKVPLAAPSANKFGHTSPTEASHVRDEFKNDSVFVLDGGPCEIGIESTVLKIIKNDSETELAILRQGHYSEKDIKKILSSYKIKFTNITDAKESPGQMKHHYMPSIPLIIALKRKELDQLSVQIFENISSLPAEIDQVKIVKLLAPPKKMTELILSTDPRLATREFYSKLRKLAGSGCECIVYFKESNKNEAWGALYERMDKAASLILKD